MHGVESLHGQFRRHAGIGERLLQLGIEPVDDRPGRARRRKAADPRRELIARYGLRDRGDIGELIGALVRSHAQRPHPVRLDVRKQRTYRGDHRVRLPGDQGGPGRPAAPVRHVYHLAVGDRSEQRHRQMHEAAIAGRRVVDLTGTRFGQREELFHRLCRQGRMHDQHAHLSCERGYADEVLQNIVGKFFVEVRVGHVRRRLHHDRVAVRGTTCHHFGTDGARGPAAILDDKLLAHNFRHLLKHDAGDHVVGTAGREHDDDAYGFVGIGLCNGGGRETYRQSKNRYSHTIKQFHVLTPRSTGY